MWSMTIRSRPPDFPITFSQKAPCVPFSNWPMTVSTVSSSGSRSTSSVISSISMPSPRPMRRMLPPHTIVGMDGNSIIGMSSIDPPNPQSTFTACGWSYVE